MIRALLWLQWRLILNGARHKGRDAVERASRFAQLAIPIVVAVLLVPLTLALATLAVVAGWQLAEAGQDRLTITLAVGFPLALPFLWVLARPFVPAEHVQITRADLLRLLPIPRHVLHRIELLAVLVDPLVFPFAVALLVLPLGSVAAGRPLLALGALFACVVFLALLAGLGVLAMALVQLFLRDRRRAEAAALLFFLVASVGGWLPQLFGHGERGSQRNRDAGAPTAAAESAPPTVEQAPVALSLLPPAALAMTLSDLAGNRVRAAVAPMAAMLLLAFASYTLALRVDRRLRETPARSPSGSGRASGRHALQRLPFVSPAAAAVAWVHTRTFLRTTRGRMALVGPPLMVVLFGMLATRSARGPVALLHAPLALAAFGVWICLSNLATTVATNQFAVAGGGLVLELLQPIDDRTLLRGRAVGQATILVIQIVLVLGPLALLFRTVSAAVWLAIFLGGLAVYALASPLFGLLSAVVPKTADLSRMGRAGNTSVVASFVTLPALPLAAVPVAGLGWLALGVLHQPWLFPPLAAIWLVCSIVFARAMSRPVARIVHARRENLALVATGR